MKWFKHLTTSISDPDIMESELRFKANGPYVFFRTLEILAREDCIDKPLQIHFKVFKAYFPSTSAKVLLKVLQYFSEKSRISYTKVENNSQVQLALKEILTKIMTQNNQALFNILVNKLGVNKISNIFNNKDKACILKLVDDQYQAECKFANFAVFKQLKD